MTPEQAADARFIFCLTCGEVLEGHEMEFKRFSEAHSGHDVAFSIQPEGLDYWVRITIGATNMTERWKNVNNYYRNAVRSTVDNLFAIMEPDPMKVSAMNYPEALRHAASLLEAEARDKDLEPPDGVAALSKQEVCTLSSCGAPVSPETRVWSAVDGVFCTEAHFMTFREQKLAAPPVAEELPALGLPLD